MSHLDFDHPMSDTMEITEIDRVQIIVYAYSQEAFELVVPLDLAEDILYGNSLKSELQTIATRCEDHLQ
jgi:hypothetical protein